MRKFVSLYFSGGVARLRSLSTRTRTIEPVDSVLEVEAGRGVVNHQFLKDLFQACMMYEVNYLAIAIRRVYKGARDFETVCRFFDHCTQATALNFRWKAYLLLGIDPEVPGLVFLAVSL